MANELQIDYGSGYTLYAVIRNQAGLVNVAGTATFEAWGTSGHTADNYDIALSGDNGGRYKGDFNAAITNAGHYTVQVFEQPGSVPADGDKLAGSGEIIWNGTAEVSDLNTEIFVKAAKTLVNKAVQAKSTGVINYYDDDGSTILLTHTPTDAEATITRTPS